MIDLFCYLTTASGETIVHLPRDTGRLEIIPCPYLEREVDLIIEEFENSQ